MDVFAVFKEWYAWAIATPVAAAILLGWKYRQAIKDEWMFWTKFRKRFEALENRVMNPVSPEARLCPNCDKRMTTQQGRFDYWWYTCTNCDKSYAFPAPTAHLTKRTQ